MNIQEKQSKGFTIIEVVLVLAIAALIFLMVFIAVPALQANQRDTARKNDAGTVAAAVQSFISNERRSLTVADQSALRGYVERLDQYETNNIVVSAKRTDYTSPPNESTLDSDTIRVFLQNKCDGTKVKDGTSRSAAVFVRLEGSGGSPYCVDV